MASSIGVSNSIGSGSRRSVAWALRSLALCGTLGAFVACGGGQAQSSASNTPAGGALSPSNDNGPADDAPITDPPTPPKATGNPLKGIKLWIDPETNAALRANALDSTQPDVAKLFRDKIAKYSQALWLGEWNSNVYRKVKWTVDQSSAKGEVPTFILYNVPGRDCGQHSAGGLKTKESYQRWVRKVAAGVGDPAGDRANLADLMRWCADGKLSAHVHAVYPLSETAQALKAIAARKVMGKVILRP